MAQSEPQANSSCPLTSADIARQMYQIYGASLDWKRSHDNSSLRRWSIHDGAGRYAMDDGSSAGELERDAWHSVADIWHSIVAESVGRLRVCNRVQSQLASDFYGAYQAFLGGQSSYAAHEQLLPWPDICERDRAGWMAVADYLIAKTYTPQPRTHLTPESARKLADAIGHYLELHQVLTNRLAELARVRREGSAAERAVWDKYNPVVDELEVATARSKVEHLAKLVETRTEQEEDVNIKEGP